MQTINRYNNLKKLVVNRLEQFTNLMEFAEKKTDWLKAPASTRFHMCREGGLVEHSCNVAETMLKLREVLAPDISEESCVIVALLHDLGKAGVPGNPQYLPNESDRKGGYRSYTAPPYLFNNDLVYLSVPVRSLYLAAPYISLTEEEAQAIIYHDGQYVDDNASVATKEEPLTLLLQYADNWCGFVLEKDTIPQR